MHLKKLRSLILSGILMFIWNSRICATQRLPEKRRKNIFILIDDQCYDILSFFGHFWIKTREIDKLADNGLYSSNTFVTKFSVSLTFFKV